jgi:hypothetical protein
LHLLPVSFAQQIGNPNCSRGVLPPRGTFRDSQRTHRHRQRPDIENGTVVIRDGKIEAVGANVYVPAGAQTIDGRGLVSLSGHDRRRHEHGPRRSSAGRERHGRSSEVGDLNPNAKAIIAVNPHSAHIAVTRVEGITNT